MLFRSLRLLNPSVGTLNVFLKNLLHLAENPFDIYTVGGLVWVLTSFYYPYAFITIFPGDNRNCSP